MRTVVAHRVGTTVHAVIAGSPPEALIEEEGRIRIVSIGDPAGGSRVAAITANGITLRNGIAVRVTAGTP